MPTFTSNDIINHLNTVAPHRNVSTDVNNIIMEQQKSKRKKTYQYDCKVLQRNEKARKRLQRKLIIKRIAAAKKRAERRPPIELKPLKKQTN